MNRRQFILTTSAVVALPSVGHGYILPSHYVVKQAQRFLDGQRGLQVGLLGRAWGEDRLRAVEVGERWIFGATTRLDVTDTGGRTASWSAGTEPSGDTGLLPPAAVRFVLSGLFGGSDLSQHLAGLGILANPRSLQLFDGEVAISIGAEAGRRDVPQAWFHQETFQPVRFIFRSDRSIYDLRMSEWSSPKTRGVFPRKIDIRKDGRPLRQLTVSTLRARKSPQ